MIYLIYKEDNYMDIKCLRKSLQDDIKSFELAVEIGKDLDICIEELQSSLKANYYGHVIDEETFNSLWNTYFGGGIKLVW